MIVIQLWYPPYTTLQLPNIWRPRIPSNVIAEPWNSGAPYFQTKTWSERCRRWTKTAPWSSVAFGSHDASTSTGPPIPGPSTPFLEVSKESLAEVETCYFPLDTIGERHRSLRFSVLSISHHQVMWVLDFYAVEPTGNEEVARLAWEEQLGGAGLWVGFCEPWQPHSMTWWDSLTCFQLQSSWTLDMATAIDVLWPLSIPIPFPNLMKGKSVGKPTA